MSDDLKGTGYDGPCCWLGVKRRGPTSVITKNADGTFTVSEVPDSAEYFDRESGEWRKCRPYQEPA